MNCEIDSVRDACIVYSRNCNCEKIAEFFLCLCDRSYGRSSNRTMIERDSGMSSESGAIDRIELCSSRIFCRNIEQNIERNIWMDDELAEQEVALAKSSWQGKIVSL